MAENTQITPEQEIAALKAELAKERAEKEEQAQLIEEQNEALALAEAAKGRVLPVAQDSKKKKYQVLAAKFQHPETGKDVTADELAKDKKLVDELLAIGSGLLQEIVESK